MKKRIDIHGQRVELYSSDEGCTWSSNPQSIAAMKINYLEKESLSPWALDQENKISYWQLIFLQSRANGCCYNSEDLPRVNWQWPKDTWCQDRVSQKLGDEEFMLSDSWLR